MWADVAKSVPFELAPPFPSAQFPVEVRAAAEKGSGVFATRNIKRGQVCCWYDGYVTDLSLTAVLTTGEFGYVQKTSNDLFIAGFRTARRPGGCAQLCNDASTGPYDPDDLKYLKKINVDCRYYGNSGGIAFVSTKPIKAGEQLFYSYGEQYWQLKTVRANLAEAIQTVDHLFAVAAAEAFRTILESEGEASARRIRALLTLYSTNGESEKDYKLRLKLAMLVSKFATLIAQNV